MAGRVKKRRRALLCCRATVPTCLARCVVAIVCCFVLWCLGLAGWCAAGSRGWSARCPVESRWIGVFAFVGILGVGPSVLAVSNLLYKGQGKSNSGGVVRKARGGSVESLNNLSSGSSQGSSSGGPSFHGGYVRPSLFRHAGVGVDFNKQTPARRALLLTQMVDAVSCSTWELVLALVTLQLFVESLAVAALVAICTKIGAVLGGERLAERLGRVNRLSAMQALVVVERLCLAGAVVVLALMLNERISRPLVNQALNSALLEESLHDFSVDRAFARRDLTRDGNEARVALLVSLSTLASLARAARASLLSNEWIKIVATSPFTSGCEVMHLGGLDSAAAATIESLGETGQGGIDLVDEQQDFYEEEEQRPSPIDGDNDDKKIQQRYDQSDTERKSLVSGASNYGSFTCENPREKNAEDVISHGSRGTTTLLQGRPLGLGRPSTQAHESYRSLLVLLATTRSGFGIVAPVLLGLALSSVTWIDQSADADDAAAVAVSTFFLWQMLAMALELVSFRLAFSTDSALRTERTAAIDSSVSFYDPYGLGPATGASSKDQAIFPAKQPGQQRRQQRQPGLFKKFKRSIKEARNVARAPFFLSSLSFALLSATVLDAGVVSLTCLRWRRVPVAVLGMLVSFRHCSCGLVSCAKHVQRYTGSLARTASLSLWVVWATVLPSLVFQLISDTTIATCVILLVVLISGPVLRANSVIHARLFNEWVEDQRVSSSRRAEKAMRLVAFSAIHILAIFVQTPVDYYVLVNASVSSCLLSLVAYSIWYRTFDSGTPFQVVDDIGQLVLVVRG